MTHYDLLGVGSDASVDEIRTAWKAKLVRVHPDRQHGQADHVVARAEEEARALNEAWSVLSDPRARLRYDDELRRDEQLRRYHEDRARRHHAAASGFAATTSTGAAPPGQGPAAGRAGHTGPGSATSGGRPGPGAPEAPCPGCGVTIRLRVGANRFICPKCRTSIAVTRCPRCHHRVVVDVQAWRVLCGECLRTFSPRLRIRRPVAMVVAIFLFVDAVIFSLDGPDKATVALILTVLLLVPWLLARTSGSRRN